MIKAINGLEFLAITAEIQPAANTAAETGITTRDHAASDG